MTENESAPDLQVRRSGALLLVPKGLRRKLLLESLRSKQAAAPTQ
jgi:hypothetical protein